MDMATPDTSTTTATTATTTTTTSTTSDTTSTAPATTTATTLTTGTTTPPTIITTLAESERSDGEDGGMSEEATIAVASALACVFLLILVLVILVLWRRKRQKAHSPPPLPPLDAFGMIKRDNTLPRHEPGGSLSLPRHPAPHPHPADRAGEGRTITNNSTSNSTTTLTRGDEDPVNEGVYVNVSSKDEQHESDATYHVPFNHYPPSSSPLSSSPPRPLPPASSTPLSSTPPDGGVEEMGVLESVYMPMDVCNPNNPAAPATGESEAVYTAPDQAPLTGDSEAVYTAPDQPPTPCTTFKERGYVNLLDSSPQQQTHPPNSASHYQNLTPTDHLYGNVSPGSASGGADAGSSLNVHKMVSPETVAETLQGGAHIPLKLVPIPRPKPGRVGRSPDVPVKPSPLATSAGKQTSSKATRSQSNLSSKPRPSKPLAKNHSDLQQSPRVQMSKLLASQAKEAQQEEKSNSDSDGESYMNVNENEKRDYVNMQDDNQGEKRGNFNSQSKKRDNVNLQGETKDRVKASDKGRPTAHKTAHKLSNGSLTAPGHIGAAVVAAEPKTSVPTIGSGGEHSSELMQKLARRRQHEN